MSSFSTYTYPEEEFYRHLRQAIRRLKKTLNSSKNITELSLEMEHFINSCRHAVWPHHTSAIWHKDEAEKAVTKALSEFERYIQTIEKGRPASSHDLLEAICLVESLIDCTKGH